MVLCALFAALSAVGAFIRIPIGIVPITLQFLFTNLAGVLLGKKRGLIAVALYIFVGLIGIPVFVEGGGPAYILKPTFGYLTGMALGAYAAGWIAERGKPNYVNYFLAGCAGIIVTYFIGVLYFWLISSLYLGNTISAKTLIISCALIFIPGDIISAALGAALAGRLSPLIAKS